MTINEETRKQRSERSGLIFYTCVSHLKLSTPVRQSSDDSDASTFPFQYKSIHISYILCIT